MKNYVIDNIKLLKKSEILDWSINHHDCKATFLIKRDNERMIVNVDAYGWAADKTPLVTSLVFENCPADARRFKEELAWLEARS